MTKHVFYVNRGQQLKGEEKKPQDSDLEQFSVGIHSSVTWVKHKESAAVVPRPP